MNVRIKKADLIEILTKNRAEHRGIFEEAVDGYRQKAVATLEENLALLKANKHHRIANIYLQLPEDHTRDYDRAIKMMEMTTDEEVVLPEAEFKSYVMDDWSWANQFYGTNSVYSASAMTKLQAMSDE